VESAENATNAETFTNFELHIIMQGNEWGDG
jgi:hypothetical protein